ncbi:MAG: hypothetical protein JOY54_08255 [Acidobacteriaceae bacterium]|nr:hypothetical protein [Acidobacteriaceae bacterium]
MSLLGGLALLRLCHVNLLWADEDYHIAAAVNLLHGRVPYRDFWYDKPPLCAVYYLLCGGYWGWPLRLLDAAYVLVACRLAFRIAHEWWGEAEAWTAALLLAFFLAFYLPSTVIPFAADALMIVPHLAAIDCALRRRPLWSGIWCGIAFLFNIKAVFVLAACGLWMAAELVPLCLGFAMPVLAGLLAAVATGAWAGYYEQVWRWGLIYAEASPVTNPLALGVRRTLDWLGFHGALAAGAIYGFARFTRKERWKLGIWLAVSFAAACLGTRFAPHYYLQLLPPMVITASRGFTLAWRERRRCAQIATVLLLLVPFLRFAPRYVSLAAGDMEGRNPAWSDVKLDLDSQQVARQLEHFTHPGDTLFVWGYRPDIYVYTRMVPDGRFGDSQPITGVPADRHLHVTQVIYGGPAAANRAALRRSHPTFLVDGLGLLNPKLAPAVYPELREWLAGYQEVGRTKMSVIYRRKW